jgi:hypothetical protein
MKIAAAQRRIFELCGVPSTMRSFSAALLAGSVSAQLSRVVCPNFSRAWRFSARAAPASNSTPPLPPPAAAGLDVTYDVARLNDANNDFTWGDDRGADVYAVRLRARRVRRLGCARGRLTPARPAPLRPPRPPAG